jgi:hypothetical protein
MRRRSQVRLAVERAIWTEAEGLEAERLLDDLDDVLEEAALADGFLDGPVEAVIARIRDDLGLAASPTGEEADGEAGDRPDSPDPRVAAINSG